METFLSSLARDLYDRHGSGLSELNLLFPSRRARLFFTDALSRVSEKPMWQPHFCTIDALMEQVSGVRVGDRVRLLSELYKVWAKYHDGTFDKFYFWGEMLLADFDLVDKYRVDARMLYRNMEDIKELETDTSFFTEEQLRIVAFWANFAPGQTLSSEKQRFLKFWRTLWPIYSEFRERLLALSMGYTGLVHRVAAEKLAAGVTVEGRFVVAGFNALSECEKQLFKVLDAEFHWDYDDYYVGDRAQEAGMFLRENLKRFPGTTDHGSAHFKLSKNIEVVAAASETVQCKYVADLLRELPQPLGKQTAIVLTDETLLTPLLHALPADIGPVNVTMGYPVRQSVAYSLVERLLSLQASARSGKTGPEAFYRADVEGLISHPYLAGLSQEDIFQPALTWPSLAAYIRGILEQVARGTREKTAEAKLRVELLWLIIEQIDQLTQTLQTCDIELQNATFSLLLRRHLQSLRVPYEGEPLEGVQVMGILETRNLDFENVIVLSCSDDNFPGRLDAAASMIPPGLRAAYALPTPEHHEGVYAYYFYRLLQRAGEVRLMYSAHADEKTTGEQSRYIYQLDYESGHSIRRRSVGVEVHRAAAEPIVVEKTGETWERLQAIEKLSPTAFFRYVACPLRFYFASVAGLRVPDEVSEEVDAPMFGIILHSAAERIYRDGAWATATQEQIDRAVTEAIAEHYLDAPESEFPGNLLLVRDVVRSYLRAVVRYDARHGDFRVEAVEQRIGCDFSFDNDHRIRFEGTADRIDALDGGGVRVVDYKTGEAHLEFSGLDALFHGKAAERQGAVLQTLLYALMLSRTFQQEVVPTLYYVRKMAAPDYDPRLVDKQRRQTGVPYSDYASEFEALLAATLRELFDASIPFTQTENDAFTCGYCDYRTICRR